MSNETIDFQSILSGCKLSKSRYGYIDGTITDDGSMPNNPTPDEVIVYRRKPEYSARENQLRINLLAIGGGRPYVQGRLSRFAGETEIDWTGGSRPDGSRSTGRLQQTHSFPYLPRIASKINQYTFGTPPIREGANEDILKDITRDGKSINDLMREVSKYVFAGSWCWIGVDAPARKDDGTSYSVAEKEANKIRPYWQIYSPLDVLDWCFSETGELKWIKTRRIKYDDDDPATLPKPKEIISLWEIGKVTEYTIITSKDNRYSSGRRVQITSNEILLTDSSGSTLSKIPFVLVGEISADPIAFDDLESINRTIMDLGSVDRANIFNTVYAQLVLPASLTTRMQSDSYASSANELGKLVLGFKYPILVEADDPMPQYLMPNSGSMEIIPKRIGELKRDLFEVVGLALEQESRQVASAETKAWDFLDVSAVIIARAELLEDAERKAVALSVLWDADFDAWEPQYNRDFDVGNFKDEIAAIVSTANMPLPIEVSRELVKKIVDRLDRIGSAIPAEDKQVMTDAISIWNPNEFTNNLEIPAP